MMQTTTKNQVVRTFRLNACARCGGSAYLDRSDEPEWRCLQCGRTVPGPVSQLRTERSFPSA